MASGQPAFMADGTYARYQFEPSPMDAPAPRPPALRQTSTTSRAAAADKKVITRNRASYSCHNCRRRKIKCDKTHPICGACSRTSEDCVYNENNNQDPISTSTSTYTESSPEEMRLGVKRRIDNSASRESSTERTSPTTSEGTYEPRKQSSIEDRLDRLTSLVEALSNGKAHEEEPVDNFGHRIGLREIDANGVPPRRNSLKFGSTASAVVKAAADQSTRQQDRDRSRGQSTERAKWTPEPALPAGEASELADPMSKMNLGYLSVQEGGRSRYVGPTFWAYVSDEIDQLNGLLRDQNRYHPTEKEACGKTDESMSDDGADAEAADSPSSEDSDDSHIHNSFHRAGDKDHHHKSQLRDTCPACQRNFSDKSVLLQNLEAHPSRFKQMSSGMIEGLPTRAQANVLFRCWLSGVHGLIPLVYPPLGLARHEVFWDWYEKDRKDGKPCTEIAALPLFYAIWYAGSVSISIHGLRHFFPGETRAKLSARLHDQTTRWLALLSFPRNASLPGLAAFIMMQTILAKEEEPVTSSLYISLAIRVAQQLGLHREPSLFNFSPWEVETRRRIWWQLMHLDCVVAISSGLPPLISDSYYDTKMISEVKDLKLGTKEADEYQEAVENGTRKRENPDEPFASNRDSMVSVAYVFARGKYVMTRGIRRLLKIHLGTKPITKGDMQDMRTILHEVDRDLNEIIDRIPAKGIPEMGFTPDPTSKDPNPLYDADPDLAKAPSEEELRPFSGMIPKEGLTEVTIQYHWNSLISMHKWARIVLSMLIDKAYCVFYAPFLKNARSKFWPAARSCALKHCHSFMRKFISLATDPAFQPFHWSWPGMHQPMHATMILLVDLYERPKSVEAPRSRALIDKIFSMSSADGGIVSGEDGVTVQRPLREGGREAWDMLRRLREKAWQKAGLDPDVLWTEEDQIKAGVAEPPTDFQKLERSMREDLIAEPVDMDKKDTVEACQERLKQSGSPEDIEKGKVAKEDRPKTLTSIPSQQKAPFRNTNTKRAKLNHLENTEKARYNLSSAANLHGETPTSIPVPTNQPQNALYHPPISTPHMEAPTTNGTYFPPGEQVPNDIRYNQMHDFYYHPPPGVGSHQLQAALLQHHYQHRQSQSFDPRLASPEILAAIHNAQMQNPTTSAAYNTALPTPLSSVSQVDAASMTPTYIANLSNGVRQLAASQSGQSGQVPLQASNGSNVRPQVPSKDTQDQQAHFDWAQWDAVFGSHGASAMPFEDAMDINWETNDHQHDSEM